MTLSGSIGPVDAFFTAATSAPANLFAKTMRPYPTRSIAIGGVMSLRVSAPTGAAYLHCLMQ
jgi:hypothetical protein